MTNLRDGRMACGDLTRQVGQGMFHGFHKGGYVLHSPHGLMFSKLCSPNQMMGGDVASTVSALLLVAWLCFTFGAWKHLVFLEIHPNLGLTCVKVPGGWLSGVLRPALTAPTDCKGLWAVSLWTSNPSVRTSEVVSVVQCQEVGIQVDGGVAFSR